MYKVQLRGKASGVSRVLLSSEDSESHHAKQLGWDDSVLGTAREGNPHREDLHLYAGEK